MDKQAFELFRLNRRRFLAGSAGLASQAALFSLLQSERLQGASATSSKDERPTGIPHVKPRAKACIFLFLAGGTSQVELFDPKPELSRLTGTAPPDSLMAQLHPSLRNEGGRRLMGSCYGFKRYGQCGMAMSELLPRIGACADDIALIRSMYHKNPDHAQGELLLSTGQETIGRPSNGAWLSYGLGNESENLPAHVVMLNGRGPLARELVWGSGCLPAQHRGVLFRSQGEPILNLDNPAQLSRTAQRRRLDTVNALNQLRYDEVRDPEIESKIAAYELAFRLQRSAPEVSDFASESAATRQAYGVERPDQEGVFARNCLLARRLVERGVRFVTLLQAKWDHHKKIRPELAAQCRQVDQPIGALLQDLKSRGLLDSTLVVWATEFGRTPAVNGFDKPKEEVGRDHHPYGFSMWMAGGGIKGGQTLGQTDEFAWNAVEEKVHIHDFNATLLHLFGLDHQALTFPSQGLDVRLTDLEGQVVRKLIA